MSTEPIFDHSDPLKLLLSNGDSSSDESSQNDNPQDWSKFGALWADGPEHSSLKPYSDIMDLSDLTHMSMDMDFNPSMAIEPSALHHFPGSSLNFSYDEQFNPLSSELLSTQFPFMFQFGGSCHTSSSSSSASPQPSTKERRLSVTSSSSSSGASLSPVLESLPSPALRHASDNVEPKEEPIQQSAIANDPAAELAQRVRLSAGVMLAVPMNAHLQGYGVAVPTSQNQSPVTRVPRQNSVPKSSNSSTSSSAASTPPPSTPPLSSTAPFRLSVNTTNVPTSAPTSDIASTPNVTTPITALSRPKTSHTTIERRYRTNLNARIQSLRMAVPALRVLEDREGGNGKKIKKNVKGSVPIKGSGNVAIEGEDGMVVDVIDERGFVDGVKVARKCSKANVLGKAVEYIRVLKKREQRLKAEQAGLKTLVSGLVGGPALVREWEREWKTKFGGEERDEIEGEDEEGDDEDSEDDDDGDGDDEPGKKRKRAKVAANSFTAKKLTEKKSAPAALVSGSDTSAPEKRKRGRPRKILPPPASLVPERDQFMHPPTPSTATQNQQLHPWTAQQEQQQPEPQQFLLAVFALFSFLNSPLTPSWTSTSSSHGPHTGTVLTAVHPPLAYAPDIISQFVAPQPSSLPAGWDWKEYVQLFHLFVSLLVLASFVSSWLGLGFGVGISKLFESGWSFRRSVTGTTKRHGPTSWLKMGEESVLEGQASNLSLYERLQVYRSVKMDASLSDLTTLALVVASTTGALGALARIKARSIWDAAKETKANVAEKLVFDTLDIDEATVCLSKLAFSSHDERAYTPIEVLGAYVIKERVKRHLAALFAEVVAGPGVVDEDKEEEEEEERRKTVVAAQELGEHVEELGRTFERAWKLSSDDEVCSLSFDAEDADSEIRALLVALSLYRQLFSDAHNDGCGLFSSSLLSPPPSPSNKASVERGCMLLSLRKVLGSRVFEDEAICLEDTRDRVVDMIVDVERRERGSPMP